MSKGKEGKSQKRSGPFTPAKREEFFKHLRATGIVSRSAAACGVSEKTVYEWRGSDQDFAQKFDAMKQAATDDLLVEARERATTGCPKLKTHNGKLVMVPVIADGQIVLRDGEPVLQPLIEYDKSDTLLIFLLKGLMPETFRERVEQRLVGHDGGPLRIVEEVIVERQGDQAAPGASSVPPE